MIRSILLKIALLLLVLTYCSCAGNQPRIQRLVTLKEGEINRVAVVPFLNDSGFEQGGTIFQRIFASELAKVGNISLCREGDIRRIYRELVIYPYQSPNMEERRILGSRLKADILVSGTVREMEENRSSKYVNPIVAVELHAYDAGSGRTLWTTHYKKEGSDYRTFMHFGLISTVSGLSRKMSKEILKEWFPESKGK